MLGTYKNNHTPVELRCNACGHTFERSWKSYSLGAVHCPKCDPPPPSRPRTAEDEVRARFLAKDLLMTGPYQGGQVPVDAVCLHCGEPCSPRPASLFYQGGCRACGRRAGADKRRTPIDLVRQIFDECGLQFIGPYVDATTKTAARCRSCRTPVAPKLNQLLNGSGGCRPCGYTKQRGSWKAAHQVPGLLYLIDFDLDGERFRKIGIGKVGSGRLEYWRSTYLVDVAQVVHASFAACYEAERAIISERAPSVSGSTETNRMNTPSW
ncbi:hypothetical protein [Nonomuraea basaltis]|uniref:hypothetical protein n=1 Tax=Nonomuraea basaltis TaxID=2495887 RepID=UPI00110C59AF|nr:hypothetical protein [Nonomuraea basaltis]TMR87874.1 hypothetical protein EJK15_69395 [Nonomuraea basaltis]